MENLPNDAISLPSRVFYSPSEDKLYFGEVGDYKEVPRPQSFDNVLGVGNETDKEAVFTNEENSTKITPGIIHIKTGSSAYAQIESTEDDIGSRHILQPTSGILAHIGDIVVFNQNPLNEVTVTGTTSSTTLLDVSSGTLTLSESDLEVGKTYEFQIYGKYTSNADDFKFRFGLGTTYIEINVPVPGNIIDFPFRIQGNLDIVSVGGNPEAREYYFTGVIIRESSTIGIYGDPIIGNETVDDVTLGADFVFDVVPTDNSSSFTCYKAILKRLN